MSRPPRHEHGPRLVRAHVVTGGRARPSRNTLGLISQIRLREHEPPPVRLPETELSPEQERVLRLCSGGALTLAEVASSLRLPVSVTRVVVSDLVDSGHVTARNPVPTAPPGSSPRTTSPDYAQQARARLLERVLDGLQKL